MPLTTTRAIMFVVLLFMFSPPASASKPSGEGVLRFTMTQGPYEPPVEEAPKVSPPPAVRDLRPKYDGIATLTLFPRVGAAYELALPGRMALSAELFFMPLTHQVDGEEDVLVSGFGGGVGIHHYFMERAPAGLFLSGFFGVGVASADDYESEYFFEANVLLSYRWLWSSGFSISFGAGGGYLNLPGFESSFEDAVLRVQLALGWVM